MPIPPYISLMLPMLELSPKGEEIRLNNITKLLADKLELSEEEFTEILPSGQQTVFANRVGWAKTYLTKAGLLESTRRGYFRITEQGLSTLAEKPSRIDNNFLMKFEGFRQFKNKAGDESEIPVVNIHEGLETPDEVMRSAHRQIETTLAQELLERILASPHDFFERLIIKLLLTMGYGGSTADAGRALGRSGDDGVDGVIDQDALGLDRVYVQAKRYAIENSIGAGAIRDFFGSLDRHKASKGLFVTTSTFSTPAKDTAQYLSKRIVLIDGQQLTKLMIRYNVGCRVEETLYLKKIDEEFFE